jgi:hypothetical protein
MMTGMATAGGRLNRPGTTASKPSAWVSYGCLQGREVAAGLDDLVRAERAKCHKETPAHHSEEAAES